MEDAALFAPASKKTVTAQDVAHLADPERPHTITSLLLSLAACHLRAPATDQLAAHNALHLASAAVALQPGCAAAFQRLSALRTASA